MPVLSLDGEDRRKFCEYIVMADKAAAHLTSEREHNVSVAMEMPIVIFNLLKQYLYRHANRPCPTFSSLGFRNLAINSGETEDRQI